MGKFAKEIISAGALLDVITQIRFMIFPSTVQTAIALLTKNQSQMTNITAAIAAIAAMGMLIAVKSARMAQLIWELHAKTEDFTTEQLFAQIASGIIMILLLMFLSIHVHASAPKTPKLIV